MDNYTNPYEYSNTEYQQTTTPPPKKKNKVPGIILMVLGLIFLIGGIVTVFAAENFSVMETAEPIDVYYATETDEYSYALVQYMTESVAYYEAMGNMQFYIVCDSEWNPTVVCLHSDEVALYQPYIDWLYSDSYEGGPEETVIAGYAQPFDAELEQWVMEGFNETFGEEIVDESNFTDWFGEYYLQVGQKNAAYGISKIGIYILLVAVILMVIGGALLYEKKDTETVNNGGLVVEKSNVFMGIIAAVVGASLGGLLWTVVGALGFIVGWLGVLIIIFANVGYNMFEHKKAALGVAISIILGIIMVVPATYLTYAWSYYCMLNESINGYTPLGRAITELAVYFSTYDEWGTFVLDLVKGYAFLVIVSIYMLVSMLGSKKQK